MSRDTKRISSLLAIAGLAGLLGGQTFSRQGPPQETSTVLGVLTCSLVGTDATAGVQSRDVLCRFRPGRRGSEETYTGTVQSIGPAQAIYGKGTIILAVRGSASTKIEPGLLQQVYSAEASRVSAAAPLVGETNRALVLQPFLEEEGRVAAGKTRPDAAIITVELKLKASPA